jgi:hypothetical protein
MGMSGGWVGFHGLTKQEVLARMSLRDTGEIEESRQFPISGTELPNGWFVVLYDSIAWRDIGPMILEPLSAGCRMIACEFAESVMICVVGAYEDGRRVWELEKSCDQWDGLEEPIGVEGTPPAEFAAIRDEAVRQYRENFEEGVDFVYDIPLHTAEAICGYRYDNVQDGPVTRLEPEAAASGPTDGTKDDAPPTRRPATLLGQFLSSWRRRAM